MAGRGWARVPFRGEERERERERGGDGCMDMDGYGWMVGRLDGLERRGKKRMGAKSLCRCQEDERKKHGSYWYCVVYV